jgi:hypothetical protein
MKVYYALIILMQMLTASIVRDKTKRAYFGYLWSNFIIVR